MASRATPLTQNGCTGCLSVLSDRTEAFAGGGERRVRSQRSQNIVDEHNGQVRMESEDSITVAHVCFESAGAGQEGLTMMNKRVR